MLQTRQRGVRLTLYPCGALEASAFKLIQPSIGIGAFVIPFGVIAATPRPAFCYPVDSVFSALDSYLHSQCVFNPSLTKRRRQRLEGCLSCIQNLFIAVSGLSVRLSFRHSCCRTCVYRHLKAPQKPRSCAILGSKGTDTSVGLFDTPPARFRIFVCLYT